MARGLSIDIDGRGIESLASQFAATDTQVEAALRSTYNRMGRWLQTRAMRGLSAKLRIQQKVLRSRVRAFRLQGGIGQRGAGAKVWFGLRPIPFMRLNAKESGKGVRAAGGRFVEGAFIADFHGRRQVLKRDGKARLPVHIVYADIVDDSNVYIEDELVGVAAFDVQFFKFLEHELKWRTRILKSS